jgi:hypothetical protein
MYDEKNRDIPASITWTDANSSLLSARRVKVQKRIRIPQIQIQARIRSETRKHGVLTRTWSLKRNPIMSTMSQAAHTLTSVSALTRARCVVAAWEHHFAPEEARW